MNTIRGKTAIVGAAFSTVSRRGDVPLGVLAMDAVRGGAAADAGIPVSDLDGLSVYPQPLAHRCRGHGRGSTTSAPTTCSGRCG